MNKIIFLLTGLMMVTSYCSQQPSASSKDHASDTTALASVSAVTLSDEQLKNGNVVIGSPDTTPIHSVIKTTGMIDIPPSKIVSVSFPLGGYIRKMVMLPGTSVRKGSVLATLEDQQLIQLQQDYLTGLSRLHFLEADFIRQQELNKTKATSDKIFQQVKSDLESQQVMVKALAEKLQWIGITPESLNEKNLSRSIDLRSPLDGIISKVNVHSGQYITPTDVLFEI
ncbi:MAG: efflux RND transporter periplasmic adaptor subunit, partial [Chitinophagaceae bacterium]